MCFGINQCGPYEALVVSCTCTGSKKIIPPGGRTLSWPGCLQRRQMLKLAMHQLDFSSEALAASNVPATLKSKAEIKVGPLHTHAFNSDDGGFRILQTACERYLDATDDDVRREAIGVIERHIRKKALATSVKDIHHDRRQFTSSVYESASHDLEKIGLSLVSYVMTDVTDGAGIIEGIKREREENVLREEGFTEAEIEEYFNSRKREDVET